MDSNWSLGPETAVSTQRGLIYTDPLLGKDFCYVLEFVADRNRRGWLITRAATSPRLLRYLNSIESRFKGGYRFFTRDKDVTRMPFKSLKRAREFFENRLERESYLMSQAIHSLMPGMVEIEEQMELAGETVLKDKDGRLQTVKVDIELL